MFNNIFFGCFSLSRLQLFVEYCIQFSNCLKKHPNNCCIDAATELLQFTIPNLKETALEYELKALEQIVSVIEHPSNLKPGKQDAALLGKYKRLAHIEKERIKFKFIQASFEPGSEDRIEMYFRQHQLVLVQLTDIFYRASKGNVHDKLSKELIDCVDFLLQFIETQFPKYFDREVKIPEAKRLQMAPEIKRTLKFLQTSFMVNGVPDELINHVCQPMEDYFLPVTVVNYREYYFIKDLQHELLLLAKHKAPNNYTEQICNRLLFLNFNSLQFFNYYIEKLSDSSNKYETTQELIEFFSMEMKLINQVIVKPGSVYKSELPSLCDQIGTWLGEEIYFLEKKQQLLQLPLGPALKTDIGPKVHTSLPVAHLSLVIRLLLDANLIKNKNAAELLKRVAGSFRTDKCEHISEDSLRNKFYNFDDHTVDQVKDVIKGLMGVVMRYTS